MTVGTGINQGSEEEGYKSMANKLYSSINRIFPNFVVFFATEKSKETIKYIEELFKMENDIFVEDEDYEIKYIEEIDDFNHCFEIIEQGVWFYDILSEDNVEIVMDYTSGTKTMSAAIACCGMMYNKTLVSVGGDRSAGLVAQGTESINYQNLYKIYDKFAIMRVRSNFNANRFFTNIDVLNNIVDSSIAKDDLLNLCKSYYAWENMDFNEAYNFMTQINMDRLIFYEIKEELKKNLKALGAICKSKSENLKNCYILASLINNSIRRAEEYKYDDAIARLYRAFELIAQIRLHKYNLFSSDIDVEILKNKGVGEEFIQDLERKREEDGKIKIGLIKDYNLLYQLDDDLGKYFIENENRIRNMTKKRNESILAHGLESQNKESFDEFLDLIVTLAKKLDKDMNKFLDETKFAKFDLKVDINKD